METSAREGRRARPSDGTVLETEILRVVLKEWPADRYVRFLVLGQPCRRTGDRCSSAAVLLASGTEESVPAAMRAAERMLARMAGRPLAASPPFGERQPRP